jgi:ATP-binding cassette, subfamily C (CFTR/MRP), member 1
MTILFILATSISILILGLWINKWGNSSDYEESSYIWMYLLLVALSSLAIILIFIFVVYSPILLNVYKDMIKGALFAPLTYFDTTPIAKIIHRLSSDLNMLDKIVLVQYFGFTTHVAIASCLALSIIYIYVKTQHYVLLIIFVLFFTAILYYYRKYLNAVKAYRQAEDDFKIPINSLFTEVVQGQ